MERDQHATVVSLGDALPRRHDGRGHTAQRDARDLDRVVALKCRERLGVALRASARGVRELRCVGLLELRTSEVRLLEDKRRDMEGPVRVDDGWRLRGCRRTRTRAGGGD